MTPSKNDIVTDMRRVASLLGIRAGEEFARSEYLGNGAQYSYYQIYDGGQTWHELCQEAGFSTKVKDFVPDEVYFERLSNAVKSLGRYPKSSERKKLGLTFSKRRYAILPRWRSTMLTENPYSRQGESTLFFQFCGLDNGVNLKLC